MSQVIIDLSVSSKIIIKFLFSLLTTVTAVVQTKIQWNKNKRSLKEFYIGNGYIEVDYTGKVFATEK